MILSGEGFSTQKFTPPQAATQAARNTPYFVDIYKSALTGLKLGPLSVGPVEMDPIVQVPRTRQRQQQQRPNNDPLDSLFGDDPYEAYNNMMPPRKIKLQSEPVTLEIKPLPEEGKPADFTGAIGQFRLEADAVPRKAQTGEPVTVRLRLSGQGNFDRVAPPTLTDEKGLRLYPATSKFRPDDEVNLNGTKTFEQVVIADSARGSLPGYRFNYLDPATGRYVTLETPPIAVKVEGADLSTPTPAPAALAAATPAATPTPAPTPRRAPEDIDYIRLDAGRQMEAGAFLPLYRRPAFWVAQGALLAGLLAWGGVAGARARGRDEANRRAARLARQQGELQRALRSEGTGRQEFYSAAARLAQLRAATAIGQPDASLSAADICRVRQLDPQTAGSVQDIFHRHDELAYSGGAAAQNPVPADERQSVLATLDTLGRH